MTWAALVAYSLVVAAPCGERGVVISEVGEPPPQQVRRAISEQLAVELAALSYQECHGGEAPTRVVWRWWSPTKVTIEVSVLGRTHQKTVERDASALALAVPVFTAELLRDPLWVAEQVAQPEPALPEPRSEHTHLIASAEGLYSSLGTAFGGGALGIERELGRFCLEAALGALGTAVTPSPSGAVRAWGFTLRAGVALRLLASERLSLELSAHALGLLLNVVGLSSTSAAGLTSWSPTVAARVGPRLRGHFGALVLSLAAGAGGWLRGALVRDGLSQVLGVSGVEGWVQLGAGVEL